MAVQQIVTVYINLKGDGSATTFVFPMSNLYVQSFGGSIPYGSAGVVPSLIAVNNPPVPVTSATVDTFGNITITLTTALGAGIVQNFELDLLFNSGAATATTVVQTDEVALFGHANAAMDVVITGATAAANALQVAGVFNTAAPTLTNGQGASLQLDASGNLKITGSFSSGALPDLVGTLVALNALNVAATINAFGYNGVGMILAAGTLIGTIVPECSLDGGTTWISTFFYNPTTTAQSASIAFGAANTVQSLALIPVQGASNYRVRVSAFTSGTANCTLRANSSSENPSTANIVSQGGTPVNVFPGNHITVQPDPSQIFVDTFDSTLDTTNNWNSPTSSGGGVAAATATGVLTLGTGTTANGYSYLQSQVNIPPAVPSYITAQFVIKLETPVQTNTYRFWGFGTSPATPTAAAPLTNAVGFELFTDQKLYAVVYSGGTRTVIQDFSAATGNNKQPTDANYHRYGIVWRSDKQFFTLDSADAVGTGNFTFPQVQTLPIKLQAVANTSAPSASGVITCTSIGVGDSGCNSITIADATYGFRGATVDASGNLHVGTQPIQTFTTGTVIAAATTSGTTQTIDSPGTGVQPQGYFVQLNQAAGITAGAITFQVTGDGTNWITIPAGQVLDPTTLLPITLPYTLQASTNKQFKILLFGYTGLRLEVSTTTAGAAVSPFWATINSLAVNVPLGDYNSTIPAIATGQSIARQVDTTGGLYVNTEGRKQTYSAAAIGFTPIATTTGPTFSLTGSSTKTVRITKIRVSASAATGGVADISLKRFSALSGGTSAAVANIGKLDTNNATATAAPLTWSVVATTATLNGVLRSEHYEIVTPTATAGGPELIEWNFGQIGGAQALVLRGTGDFMGILFSSVATTPVADIWVEWTEE